MKHLILGILLVVQLDSVVATGAAAEAPVTWLVHCTGGKTWPSHHVISERAGFNDTTIREIIPGRLLHMHAGRIPGTLAPINSLHTDVSLTK